MVVEAGLKGLESSAIFTGIWPHFCVGLSSHHLFRNTSLTSWDISAAAASGQLEGLFLVFVSRCVSTAQDRSVPFMFPTGCVSSRCFSLASISFS